MKKALRTMSFKEQLRQTIREVKDFPEPGISFKDITPVLQDPLLSAQVVASLAEHAQELKVDVIAGIDSRGFLFGASLARQLNLPFVLIRKQGKLPADTVSCSYELEYGSATLEMHRDAVGPGQRVLIHDDLLATGGTAAAAAQLVNELGGVVAGFGFVLHLAFLGGEARIQPFGAPVFSLLSYD